MNRSIGVSTIGVGLDAACAAFWGFAMSRMVFGSLWSMKVSDSVSLE